MKLYEFRYTGAGTDEGRVDVVASNIHVAIDAFLRQYRGCEIQWIIMKSSEVLLG